MRILRSKRRWIMFLLVLAPELLLMPLLSTVAERLTISKARAGLWGAASRSM
jgi:hypothetical protein